MVVDTPEIPLHLDIFSFQTFLRLEIPIILTNGQQITAFLDTGANYSLIDAQYQSLLSNFENTKFAYRKVDGTLSTTLGSGLLDFSINDHECQLKFHSISNLVSKIILGMDFLQKYIQKIDIQNNSLEFLPSNISVQAFALDILSNPDMNHFHPTSTTYAITSEELVLPANSLLNVKLKLSGPFWGQVFKSAFITQNFLLHYSINISNVTWDIPYLKCTLENSSQQAIVIPANIKILELSNSMIEINQLTVLDKFSQSLIQYQNSPIYPILLKYNHDLLHTKPSIKLPEVHINLIQDAYPKRFRPYIVGLKTQTIIDKQVKEWLDSGIIRKSTSEWASPLVVVPKKDGSHRICVDFRYINQFIIPIVFPLPRISDLLHKMQNSKFFSKIDLQHSFLQLPLSEHSKQFTAFITTTGCYEFNKMPFGLSIATTIFQKTLSDLLEDIEFVANFVDDLCIFSNDLDLHLQHLSSILNRLSSAGLLINLKKCTFLQTSITYLGYTISANGYLPDSANISALMKITSLKNAKEVKSFLSACLFYKDFIPNFSECTSALRNLTLPNQKFQWLPIHQLEFESLKQMLCSPPILKLFDPSKEILLKVDASDKAVAAILVQLHNNKECVVAYASKALSKSQQKWSTTNKELFSIVFGIKHFKQFLEQPFTVITDHHSLCYIFSMKDPPPLLARWLMFLQAYKFRVVYRKGTCHSDVDCLSRIGVEACFSDLNLNFIDIDILIKEQSLDTACQRALTLNDNVTKDSSSGLIVYSKLRSGQKLSLIYVPKSLVLNLISIAHTDALTGHFGIYKTWLRLRDDYYWPHQFKDIRSFVQTCEQCQRFNIPTELPSGLLMPISAPYVFHTLAMDFITVSETPSGNKYILTAVDLFSKFVFAVPSKHADATTVANFLIYSIGLTFGFPQRLLSDRGTQFLSEIISELLRLLKIKKVNTSGYHPSCNGQSERTNQIVLNLLSKFSYEEPNRWDIFLPFVISQINTSTQITTRFSPFEVVFGFKPKIISLSLSGLPSHFTDTVENRVLHGFSRVRDMVTECTNYAKDQQCQFYDASHKDTIFQLNDLVLVKDSRIPRKGEKLKPKYLGPFRILYKINNVSYMLVHGSKQFSCHVSRMKLYHPNTSNVISQDPSLRPSAVSQPSDFQIFPTLPIFPPIEEPLQAPQPVEPQLLQPVQDQPDHLALPLLPLPVVHHEPPPILDSPQQRPPMPPPSRLPTPVAGPSAAQLLRRSTRQRRLPSWHSDYSTE